MTSFHTAKYERYNYVFNEEGKSKILILFLHSKERDLFSFEGIVKYLKIYRARALFTVLG